MKAFVDKQVKARGYGSQSEYLRNLSKDKLRAMVTEGLASPPGRPWSEFKADLVARAQTHRDMAAQRSK